MATYVGARPRYRTGGGWYSEPERICNNFPPSGVFQANGRLWRAQRCLGKGSSAAVYRVTSGAARAAVKQFIHDTKSDYGFLTESGVLEDLQGHRNIVTLYGRFSNLSYTNQRCNCILLELLDASVSELLLHSINRGHSMWMIQHCARDVLNALAFIHREGYVHADLKPCNILWSAEDECFKLIDFGLSFQEGNQDVKYIQTDGYRAPEAELHNILAQMGLESNTECTTAVDVWSLGIILLEMFSGMKLKETIKSPQWKANSPAIIDSIFASKDMVYSAIPVYHLRDVIKSMLHDDPAQRTTAECALYSPFFSIPFAPHIEDLVMLPTPVLRLLNVIDDGHLQSEEEYEDVVEDVREECQKFGPVISLHVPKENPGKGQSSELALPSSKICVCPPQVSLFLQTCFKKYKNCSSDLISSSVLDGTMLCRQKRLDLTFTESVFYKMLERRKLNYLFHWIVKWKEPPHAMISPNHSYFVCFRIGA